MNLSTFPHAMSLRTCMTCHTGTCAPFRLPLFPHRPRPRIRAPKYPVLRALSPCLTATPTLGFLPSRIWRTTGPIRMAGTMGHVPRGKPVSFDFDVAAGRIEPRVRGCAQVHGSTIEADGGYLFVSHLPFRFYFFSFRVSEPSPLDYIIDSRTLPTPIQDSNPLTQHNTTPNRPQPLSRPRTTPPRKQPNQTHQKTKQKTPTKQPKPKPKTLQEKHKNVYLHNAHPHLRPLLTRGHGAHLRATVPGGPRLRHIRQLP